MCMYTVTDLQFAYVMKLTASNNWSSATPYSTSTYIIIYTSPDPRPGEPRSLDRLDALLKSHSYRSCNGDAETEYPVFATFVDVQRRRDAGCPGSGVELQERGQFLPPPPPSNDGCRAGRERSWQHGEHLL